MSQARSKKCGRCLEVLAVADFGPSKQRKDGLRPVCRECHRKSNAESRARNLETCRQASASWRKRNPERLKAKAEKWNRENPGRLAELQKAWRQRNADRVKAAQDRRRADPGVRAMRSIGQRIRSLVGGKESKTTAALVGYTGEELVGHIQKQFLSGMSWGNYGEWHIDHIVPLSSFKVEAVGDPNIRRAWALSNLRPLWAEDNLRKRAKHLFLI